ncbi:peptidyl-tRNA hydrolase (PTRHD1) [Vairimorpha necatrix]|uniref:peptidyl-tRNA hydrolase n=1 Tax=Vairimorpha necatrix TaxID=6039 RepID=A0AAX4J8T0_9MICR
MIVQYIFLVSNIKTIKKGALIAQACHAAIKAIHTYKDSEDTKEYLNLIYSMTTVILKISTEDIKIISEKFSSLDFVEWVEQPENLTTCLALRPYKIKDLEDFLPFIKNYKLF